MGFYNKCSGGYLFAAYLWRDDTKNNSGKKSTQPGDGVGSYHTNPFDSIQASQLTAGEIYNDNRQASCKKER